MITGFIGATAIAVWFLIVDTIAGHAFYTPIFLGKGVVSILGKNMMGDTAFTHVLGYTIFHYAAFFIVGILLTVIVHQAERTPGILAGLLVAFVMMTLGFYMIAAVFTQSALGGMSWAQIFIANLAKASQNFQVLIIKTTMTIPYTTVFLQLDCAYWSADAERKLRSQMAQKPRR